MKKNQRYTVIFYLCFFVFSLLFVGSHLILEASIDHSDIIANVVNQNGRQRMLTEKIARYSLLCVSQPEGKNQGMVQHFAEELQTTHLRTLSGLRQIFSAHQLEDYNEEITELQQSVAVYVTHAKSLVETSAAELNTNNPDYLYLTGASEQSVILAADQMANAIHALLHRKMASDGRLADIILVGSLFLMGLIAVLVMRPLLLISKKSTELDERSRLLESVVDNALDAIVITKVAVGVNAPEIAYVNSAFTQVSGYSQAESIGRTPEFFHGREEATVPLQSIIEVLQRGETYKGEIQNFNKTGAAYWIDLTVVPIRNESGVVTHFAAFQRDITARKKAESIHADMLLQMRRINQKTEVMTRQLEESLIAAKDANRAKDEFLANMSHEIRTPMNGVIGMALLLADSNLSAEQQEYVKAINGSAETLRMLLNDILDLSKIEAGVLTLESIVIDPVDTIRETARLLRPLALKKGYDLRLELMGDLPRAIISDPGRLRQIVTNLLGNAIKFTEKGFVRIFAAADHNGEMTTLRLEIEDSGIGIPADKIATIFDKFTQADASITRRYGGTGLGLAITRQLVALMGGQISVESKVGKGSKFIVRLPVKVTDESALLPDTTETCPWSEHQLVPAGQSRILIVEDYPVNQVFARKLLEKFGFIKIDLASDGLQALMMVRENRYDVVFMDCQMPELDGYQASAKIREFEKGSGRHVPIIAMTANAMIGDREKCLKAGMDDYVSKPLRPDLLRKAVSRWISLPGGQLVKPTASEPVAAVAPAPAQIPAPVSPSALAVPLSEPAESQVLSEVPRPPPVDLEQLRHVTDGNIEEEWALGVMFAEQAVLSLAELMRALAENDLAAWRKAAHQMKGASANLGARHLSHLCKEAEGSGSTDSRFGIEALQAIREEVEAVEKFLRSALT